MDIMQAPTPGADPNAPLPPEKLAELQGLLEKVKGKYGEWNTAKFSMQNRVEAGKSDALKQVFQLFGQNGVDLADPQAVGQFMAELKTKSPEKYAACEAALDYLLGSDYENTNPTEQPEGPSAIPEEQAQAVLPPEGV